MMKFLLVLMLFTLGGCEKKSSVTQESYKTLAHPLTDQEHVDVYTFVGKYLEDIPNDLSQSEVKKWLEREKVIAKNPSSKPHKASMYELEMSGLLRILLEKDARYINITLYGKHGNGLATSGMRHELELGKERPEELTLGFLTKEALNGSITYKYTQSGQSYTERILPIYKMKSGGYSTHKDNGKTQYMLIGYFSYIIR